MTTVFQQTDNHKKAQAISSGSLKLVNNSVPSTRQVLAGDALLLKAEVMYLESDNTITVGYIAADRVRKSLMIWFKQHRKIGGV